MGRIPAQLPLALSHPPQYGRDSFIVGQSNREALALVEAWPHWPAPVVVLSGPPGSGKTHLAHIWAERAGAEIVAAGMFESDPLPRFPGRGLAVENVDSEEAPEQALFHAINQAKEAETSILVTSRRPISEWRVTLPDLRSRLRLAAAAALASPDDALLRQVLVKLFADRQLIVDRSVLDYLLLRMERSLAAASLLVEALDREALAGGRRITRPMAAEVLAGMERSSKESLGDRSEFG